MAAHEPMCGNAVLEFQEQLERDGIMFAAGPNWTDDGPSVLRG
jgi:hypothetical protein